MKSKIKIVGIGNSGVNIIDNMISKMGQNNFDFIVINTDLHSLNCSHAPHKLYMDINNAKGLDPNIGREVATKSLEEIKAILAGADIVFLVTGMGGSTGTGAVPIIARAAKEIGALTVSIVTSPFKFEGRKRTKLAIEGFGELKREGDSIIVVPNEKLFSIVEKYLSIKESFRMVDDILAQAVGAISKVILSHGENDINLDDVKTVMSHRGLALMGMGYGTGANAAHDAAKEAINSPILDGISIDGAMGVLVHFDIHPDYPMTEINKAMSFINKNAKEDADVVWAAIKNNNMTIDEVKITVVATGFEAKLESITATTELKYSFEYINNKDYYPFWFW